ncbi:tubulin polymerization-promoting protein family member 3-like [Hippocampus zosterae]|uniref:tubulin polymerization-promoting protein family member 3-like n=1 Tax=Hippocampus zosterae TaxID=109293 RepID=UPI00223DC94D|nr:tubulin polymerization-promoting protein family member 3-like [Hippocampus zosterae]
MSLMVLGGTLSLLLLLLSTHQHRCRHRSRAWEWQRGGKEVEEKEEEGGQEGRAAVSDFRDFLQLATGKHPAASSSSMAEGPVSTSEVETSFQKFAVHGDSKATGKEMNGKNFAKICKDCLIIDGKNVTTTDVDIVFTKVKSKSARVITFEQFIMALTELGPKRYKGKSKEEALQLLYGLIVGKEPANAGITRPAKAAAVDRLTDTSKYTGTHKERFGESGKGKGKVGREDIPDMSGYVAAYKGSGSYDDKVKES